jgi:hypothetical protein
MNDKFCEVPIELEVCNRSITFENSNNRELDKPTVI